MYRLTNAIRGYSWGSHTHIPRLLGRPTDAGPAAELWMGAHPGDPSFLPDGRSLAEVIGLDPGAALGPDVARRYGPRLPFLAKLLAASEPLSLQVHPTPDDAARGFAREERQGLPRDAAHRSYKDDSHKPELIYALTRFEGMAGFRDVDRSAAILRMLRLDWLDAVADDLETGPPAEALRRVVTAILTVPDEDLRGRLAALVDAAAEAEARAHRVDPRRRPPPRERDSVERESRRVFAQTYALARRYPDDPGVLVTLLLNHVVLAPGEAMFLDAGVVHAYTSGFGVEVMAASDNVVRAGLTPKHVDVDELLAITDFEPIRAPLVEAHAAGPDEAPHVVFAPPVDEFALRVCRTPATDLPASGPRIVVALEGPLEVRTGTEALTLAAGESAWVPHSDGAIAVDGSGRCVVVSVPEPESVEGSVEPGPAR